MPYEIVMPQLGLTMTEGAVTTWLKQPGERIEKGEMLFTVETDKVEMEVESTGTGYVSALIQAGEVVPVGTVIATIGDRPGETIPLHPKAAHEAPAPSANGAASPVSEPAPQSVPATSDARNFPASPRARALAKSLGIDIQQVQPGRDTRIIEEDVIRFDKERQQSEPAKQKSQPLSASRRITAGRTSQSFERAPHFYLGAEVNATKLVALRQDLQEISQKRTGTKLTVTDLLLKALTMALAEETAVNAYWENGSVVARDSIDVGLAVQAPSGLIVPVIREAGSLSLFDLAAKRQDVANRARSASLRAEELSGGSATLSNLGTEGVDWFQAILNPPQSVILAAGAIAKRPMVVEDRLEACDSLILTLSVDHRVLDGVAGAKFLKVIKRALESPHEMLV
ncbi:MAG TPA: dihydrolipoamide acetyltransferase family protein [Nitrospira sp.]|nr:dihydrolipoamide acetyltransferase family protein [Nitrospira sp.]